MEPVLHHLARALPKALGLGEQLGEFPALRPIQSESDRAKLSGKAR